LNPKKAKTLYSEVSTDLNLDENLVKDVLDFYWSDLRKQMANLTSPRLDVINLGTFEVMPKTLEKCIEAYQEYQKMPVPKTFTKYQAYSVIEGRLKRLLEIQQELQSYKQIKQTVIEKRYGKQDQENLEE
jgi:hypothetical protein